MSECRWEVFKGRRLRLKVSHRQNESGYIAVSCLKWINMLLACSVLICGGKPLAGPTGLRP